MTPYKNLDKTALEAEYKSLLEAYNEYKKKGLSLDMSRGKPSKDQLDLSQGMFNLLALPESCVSVNGIDYRNYGILDGIAVHQHVHACLVRRR